MHEWSLVHALIEQVQSQALEHRAVAVRRVHLRVGELSGAHADLLASAFAMLRDETVCRGAELAIEWVPARWACARCAASITAGDELSCAACGGPARLAGGDELLLSRIEMEVPDDV